jgi:hypothetical protein
MQAISIRDSGIWIGTRFEHPLLSEKRDWPRRRQSTECAQVLRVPHTLRGSSQCLLKSDLRVPSDVSFRGIVQQSLVVVILVDPAVGHRWV